MSMIEQAMGAQAYGRLAPALQRFHRLSGPQLLLGWVDTAAPATAGARLMALCLGTPRRAESGPIRFELQAQPAEETWIRHFPSRTMRSCLCLHEGRVIESFGPVRLAFDVHEAQGRFEMRLQRLHVFGVPCPRWLMPAIVAHETGRGDQLHFQVEATVPMLGRVAGYRGHLVVPDRRCA